MINVFDISIKHYIEGKFYQFQEIELSTLAKSTFYYTILREPLMNIDKKITH